jgi:macrolide-specific efflux system membrane fusion protein
MSGTATVITQTYTNILLVPSAALRRSGGNEVVVAVGPDGSLIEQAVQTGVTNGSQTEIVAGVDSGTTIVANVASLANNSSDSSQTGTTSGQPTGQGFPGGGFPGGGFGGPGGVDTGNGGVVQ